MTRQTKQLFYLFDLLDTLIDTHIELFFVQRPFLLSPDVEPELISFTNEEIEQKVDNDYALEITVQKIQEFLR